MPFSFDLIATKNKARAGTMHTDHGDVPTPIFMPVGTQASVKALDAADVVGTQAPIMLANTYHLYLRPGEETVHKLGGLQKMMKWNRPVLTDSGGFQVFSLGEQLKQKKLSQQNASEDGVAINDLHPAQITEDGVEFTSHLDGGKHFFTPKKAIQIQQKLGADIIMAFDECTSDTATLAVAREAMEKTVRWAKDCKEEWEAKNRISAQGSYQALFGIVQGALHRELRQECTERIVEMDFDGVAIGGETIGYNMTGTVEVMNWIESILSANKPRYAMGLGRDPQDIIDAVLSGFDMFDCVAPTRLARNGALYNGKLEFFEHRVDTAHVLSEFANCRLPISSSRYALDSSPIQEDCDCYTCSSGYSRGYLHHLYRTKELSYYRLASIHNVRFMVRLTEQLREQILR